MSEAVIREPAARRAHREGWLSERVARARALLAPCAVCPRGCADVDRLAGDVGVCRVGRWARVAGAGPHHGEEDALRGWRGSGTIFLAGCSLRCAFCQNADISRARVGEEVGPEELAGLMLALQRRGCHNINLVTPDHVAPQLLEALPLALDRGLALPLVWNSSAYARVETLALLEGIVDVYLPDVKTLDPDRARRHLGAPDYPAVARAALAEMHRQVGDLAVDADGVARRGLLVRHLVLPGGEDDARAVAALLASLSTDTAVNVMGQYQPAHRVPGSRRHADLDRRLRPGERGAAVTAFHEAGLWRVQGP